MISELQQDLAIAYLLGDLEPGQASRFEGEMRGDAELAKFTEELRECAAVLALAMPPQEPPAALREKILTGIKSSASPGASRTAAKPVPWQWLTPALCGLAACLALALGASLLQNRIARRQATEGGAEVARLTKQLAGLSRQIATLQSASAAQRRQIVELQARDSLAEVKIATLATTVEAYQRAGVVVVWDDRSKQGLIKLVNLPKAATGKDYQLWIIDPKATGGPVSAGVLAINDGAATLDSFKATGAVTPTNGFAISVEKAGGSTKPEGTIVFAGN
jgi:anti-sigma-K factor RskA